MSIDKNVSSLKLEKYLLGELPENEMQALRMREETDDIFRAEVKMMREQNRTILEQYPFEELMSKMNLAGDDSQGSHAYTFVRIAAAVVVAVGIMAFALVGFMDGRTDEMMYVESQGMEVAMAQVDEGDTRIKGLDSRMEVWKKTGDSAVQMTNLDVASEGDELQLRYAVPEKCYGMLISMDGNGVLTVHMGEGNLAIALEPGKMTTLPFAYKLDNAPRFEKFFLLTSRSRFGIDGNDIDRVLKQEGIQVFSFTVRKQAK